VTALAAVVRDGGVQLSWSAPADTDLRDYRVCVGPAGLLHPYCKPVETTTATSAILTGLTNGESYSAGVRGVDTNGNVGLMIMTNFVPKVPTALQQSPVTTAKVTYGAALTFGATLRNAATAAPLAGEPVVLEGKRAGTASYVVLGTSLITDAAGIVTTSWKPLWGGDYRFRYAGTALGASVSAARAVTVASTLTSVLDVPQIPLGGGARISGALKPAHSKVTLDRLTAGVWKPVASTVPGSNGSYAFTVNPTVTGTYSYRVRFAGDTDHLAVTGPTRVLKVYELAILTVQPKTPEYVVVKNIGTVAVNLASWKVTSSTRSLLLPAYTLTAGSSLRVYVGKGTNVTGVRYLGSTTTAFNDVHDTIRVRDLTNRIAATRVY
jgi:hypothetical protein